MDTHQTFLRQLRNCKSLAAEKSLMDKECAYIRTAFKDEAFNEFRRNNVEKLVYLNLMGYPTNFSQIEVFKLCASSSFSDKRVGYASLPILLNESSETLMLVTQTLKNDLTNKNPYIVSMTLSAIANISSIDILRDLAPIIQNISTSKNIIVRKKAIVCLLKMQRKAQDLFDAPNLNVSYSVSEQNNGTFLAIVPLMLEKKKMDPNFFMIDKHISIFENFFKKLRITGFNPDYDIDGLNDPLLQIKLIRLFSNLDKNRNYQRILSKIIDVASETFSPKNAHNAIVYECVRTIMKLAREKVYNEIAVKISMKLLNSSENNYRFVSLNMLKNSGQEEFLNKNQSAIVKCLKDKDSSIGHKAKNLIFSLSGGVANFESILGDIVDFVAKNSKRGKTSPVTVRKIFNFIERNEKSKTKRLQTMMLASKNLPMSSDFLCSRMKSLYKEMGQRDKKDSIEEVGRKVFRKELAEPFLVALAWQTGEYGTSIDESKILLMILLSYFDISEKVLFYVTSCLYKLLQNNKRNANLLEFVNHKNSIELLTRIKEYSKSLKSVGSKSGENNKTERDLYPIKKSDIFDLE